MHGIAQPQVLLCNGTTMSTVASPALRVYFVVLSLPLLVGCRATAGQMASAAPRLHAGEVVDALYAASETYDREGRWDEAGRVLALAESVLNLGGAAEASITRARIRLQLGVVRFHIARRRGGELAPVIAILHTAQSLAQEDGDKRTEAAAIDWIAMSHYFDMLLYKRGEPEQVMTLFERALAIRQQLGDRGDIAGSLFHVGLVFEKTGRIAQARASYEASLALAEEASATAVAASCHRHLGFLAMDAGDATQAHEHFVRSLHLTEASGSSAVLAPRLVAVGESLYTTHNDTRGALEYFDRALLVSKRIGDTTYMAYADQSAAKVLLAQGRVDESARRYQSAFDSALLLPELDWQVDILIGLARAHAAASAKTEAASALAQARAIATEASDSSLLAQVAKATLTLGLAPAAGPSSAAQP